MITNTIKIKTLDNLMLKGLIYINEEKKKKILI